MLSLLNEYGIEATRNQQGEIGGFENPDIACSVCGKPVHVECKRVERLSIYAAIDQAERDANKKALPVVIHRTNRKPWLVTVTLENLMKCLNYRKENRNNEESEINGG